MAVFFNFITGVTQNRKVGSFMPVANDNTLKILNCKFPFLFPLPRLHVRKHTGQNFNYSSQNTSLFESKKGDKYWKQKGDSGTK